MKPGKKVTYISKGGSSRPATVTAVVDTGASGYKILDLTYETRTQTREVSGVVNRRDEAGKGYWQSVDE